MTEGIVTPIASSPGSTARGSGGRAIGYGEFGDPNGKPVILFHGFGDSRLTRYPDDELTARLGIRLITFDRPGIGLTDPMKELTILDRTDDVIDLLNSLGLQEVHLLGWSGGAPYALAAAGCMAGKVKRAAIVSGFGPFERPGFKRLAPREIKRVMTILKVAPWMANVMATESQKSLQSDASGAMEASRGLGGSADAGVLNMSGVRANVTAGAEEAFRQGPAGVANDMLLLFRFKWGFNPEDVHTPIDLWYGDSDQMTPPDVGRGLASVLPQPRLRVVPGAGHLLYLRNWEEILRTLVADDAPATTTTFQAIAPVAPLSPVTETLAAAALSETTTVAEPEHVPEHAKEGEPVTAQGDVLGSTPAWSWMQPEAASQAPAGAPAGKPAALEPAAYQAPSEAPAEKPAFTPRPRVTPAGGDQLARLRALGFIVDEPEPQAAPEKAEGEPEAVTAAEPEAAAEPEPAAVEAAEEPQAEAGAEADAGVEAAPAEAQVTRPELHLVQPEATPKRPSLTWQPNRVPGLIIGRPRRSAPVEPISPVAEPTPEPAAEQGEAEPVAEAAPAEPAAAVAEPEAAAPVAEPEAAAEPEPAVAEPEAAAEPEPAVAEAEAVAFTGDTEAAVEEPAAFAPEAEAPAAEPEPAARPSATRRRAARRGSAEARRLRAAGFFVSDPEEVVEAGSEAPADAERDITPAEAGHDVETAAVEAHAVEAEPVEEQAVALAAHEAAAVEPESVAAEPSAVESESVAVEASAVETDVVEAESLDVESEPAAVESATVVAAVEAASIDVEQVVDAAPSASEAEPEARAAEPEGEATVAEPEPEPVAETEPEPAAAEPEPEPVATELEEEVSEAVASPARDIDGDRLAGAGYRAPQAEPMPQIAASAAGAPVMKATARSSPAVQATGEQIVETGVGWVESVPMDAETVASAHEAEPDSPPEPMSPGDEPAPPVRDETMERLRAAGFLIGEPRRR